MFTILRRERLAAESPKRAFYELLLLDVGAGFLIEKRSGAERQILDVDAWFKSRIDDATAFFERKLKDKTNPGRRSPRKYRRVTDEEWGAMLGTGTSST